MLDALLNLKRGDVVSFVGAGGKTSLMFMLAKELSPEYRVVMTTTTKMAADEIPDSLDRIELGDDMEPKEISNRLEIRRYPVLVYSRNRENKVMGIRPELVPELQRFADIVLIEADGSRRLPLKVPGLNEPVIAENTTHVVIVYGYDALEKPVGPGATYNFDILRRLLSVDEGTEVTPEMFRRIVFDGGFMEKCGDRRIYVLINKAERNVARADVYARHLHSPSIRGVAVSSATEGWARSIDNSGRRIVGGILASGTGSRFGGNKLLHSVDDRPVLEHVLMASNVHRLERRVLVLPDDSGQMLERIDRNLLRGISVVTNPSPDSGISSSFRIALGEAGEMDAIMVFLGDMPYIGRELTDRVIDAYRDSRVGLQTKAWGCSWASGHHRQRAV